MTVPVIMAPCRAFVSLKPMQRTIDCGRTKVNTPTSSHCVKYSVAGMPPPLKGSSMAGWFALMVSMMFSYPPPAVRIPQASTAMPTSMMMPHSASVNATPRKPPMVVNKMTAAPNSTRPTMYE